MPSPHILRLGSEARDNSGSSEMESQKYCYQESDYQDIEKIYSQLEAFQPTFHDDVLLFCTIELQQ